MTETSLVTRMQNVKTPLDYMYVNVSLDIMKMDKNCTGESDRFYLTDSEALTVLCFVVKHARSN